MRAATFALALLLAPAHAGAEPGKQVIPPHAKKLAAKGRAAHAAGAYDEAIVLYRAAYRLAPSPSLLFNLAQAHRLAGDCHAAVQLYRRFLAERPRREVRSLARTHLANVQRCAEAPPRRDVAMVADPSHAAEAEVPALAAPRPGRIQRRVGLGLIVGGTLAAGFAGYYALDARDASQTIEDAYARGVKWDDVRHVAARGDRSDAIAKSLAITGGLALASGVTLYVLGKRAERAAPVAILPTRGGAEVSLAWRF